MKELDSMDQELLKMGDLYRQLEITAEKPGECYAVELKELDDAKQVEINFGELKRLTLILKELTGEP